MKKFLAVLHARNMEFLRDRSALAWNLAMPLLMVFGLAFTFSGGNKDIYKNRHRRGRGQTSHRCAQVACHSIP